MGSKKHFMIDLETMGLQTNAAIVSIGIALFDADEIIDTFYTNVSLASCLDHGLTQNQSTIDWWSKQSVEARMAWQADPQRDLPDALRLMQDWMLSQGAASSIAPWGNGADFDLVLLKSAFSACNAETPWKYYNHHCFRTMKNMFELQAMPKTGVYHNALDDAITQVKHLQRILKNFKIAL